MEDTHHPISSYSLLNKSTLDITNNEGNSDLLKVKGDKNENVPYSQGSDMKSGGDLDLESLNYLTNPINEVNRDFSTMELYDEVSKVEENNFQTLNGIPMNLHRGSIKSSISLSSLQHLNSVKDKKTERIVDFIEEELQILQDSHKREVGTLLSNQQTSLQQIRKQVREIKKLKENTKILDQQLDALYSENRNLRETISKFEENISKIPDNESITLLLRDIKEKLWGDAINITKEKEKRIHLLQRLSQTRFKLTNEKHCALLKRLWQIHSNSPTINWIDIGFKTNQPEEELGQTGILGLQNLVYFSERYTELAISRSNTNSYNWASAGISITHLLHSLLLCDTADSLSDLAPNWILRTFINLMNHSKAFEELYCVCFMIYDYVINTEPNINALTETKQKLMELLQTNPPDLSELIQNAKCL